jgi:hypothetical protein
MKRIIISSLGVLLMLVIAVSCKKSDINGDSKNLISGSYITLDSVITENLDFSNASAAVAIKVGSKGSPVASVDIYVAKDPDNVKDTTKWAKIKNVPYSDGVTLSVTTAELANALAPDVIEPGTQYVLQNVVNTKDGRKFSVINTPDTYNSFPGYNMAITWKATAVCQFSAATSAGTYKVVTDTWVDYAIGSPINVTAGPGPNQISFIMYPGSQAGGIQQTPTVVDVDPTSGQATIASQFTGYYGSATAGNKVTVTGTGFVFSCTGYATFNMTINVGGSDYSGYTFAMQK